MTRLRFHLTFPEERVKEPIIYEISQKFAVVINIRRADVSDRSGWVELELEGELPEIERTVVHLRNRGIHVDPIEKTILEG
jgi:ABC-type methionine transport system ATPase subunit